ncbi:GNAT family N-acetyltransferase [Spongiimicrobium sp. 2-473A-2-J]|uniref:GNAT family N-acetyltransferase n=1 Tax=Eudoraea algarum TaxID=3417568 RepID=UPI003D362C0A
MQEDFLDDLGDLGFTARFKRISDTLVYSAREHYKQINIGIEPNWHLIFLLLKKEGQLTVTDISQRLRFSHPAVIKITKQMKQGGYLESLVDPKDRRKQFLSLSKKALRELPGFEEEWANILGVIRGFVDDALLQGLYRLEQNLNEKSFTSRYAERYGKQRASPPGKFTIRNAKPSEFGAVGKLMVQVYSRLDGFPDRHEQPEYYEMLANIGSLTKKPRAALLVAVAPRGEILGGVVYFGDMQYYGSGGTATLEKDASGFRLLAVDHKARGLGIGKQLTQECIERTKASGRSQLIIHTTKAMQTAWKMYENMGFKRSGDLDFMQGDLPVFGFRMPL